jgi:glutathione S-transferase
MKLHYSVTSPYARMVRVLAIELGIEKELKLELTDGLLPMNRHEALSAVNPLGKVPTLETDHDSALYDSRVIMEYVAHHAGNHSMLPQEPVARFKVKVLEALAQGILDAGVAHRYETFVRPEAYRWPEYVERQKLRILDAIKVAADYQTLSLGSIAMACALGFLDFRMADLDWRSVNPDLAKWYAEFSKRPSMEQTKP